MSVPGPGHESVEKGSGPSLVVDEDLLPVSMVNEFVYCPRLFWLEHVEGVFVENRHTVEGTHVHRRVERPGGKLPAPPPAIRARGDRLSARDDDRGDEADGDGRPGASGDDDAGAAPWHARALWLGDAELGVSGKVDLVETDGQGVMPVDTKKGHARPDGTLWPADEAQLTLQALLLRAAGYDCRRIAVFYHSQRRRVTLELTDDMIARALQAVAGARACAQGDRAPPPLVDSPKCPGCSLNIVCLPDEMIALGAGSHDRLEERHRAGASAESHAVARAAALREREVAPAAPGADASAEPGVEPSRRPIRRVVPLADDAVPLYVQSPGARVGLRKGCLFIQPRKGSDEEARRVGLPRTSQVNLFGTAQMSTQALQACLRRDIPVHFFTTRGWLYGRAVGFGSRQVEIRAAQFRAVGTKRALRLARRLVSDKIANGRTLLRRNGDGAAPLIADLARLRRRARAARKAKRIDELLGIEGEAARTYWGWFSELLSKGEPAFEMSGRTRRPPRDPTNALLSFGYALLVKDCTLAVASAGLDPFQGLYHTAHHGRPAMALDLMEPFRPLIVESVVLQLVRRCEVAPHHFVPTGQAVSMTEKARGVLIRGYERRMDDLITHPTFGYRISYRQVLGVQARLIARMLVGEIDKLPSFRTR